MPLHVIRRQERSGRTGTAELSRTEKVQQLRAFFIENLVEDPIDGTPFDIAVFDALQDIEQRFPTD